MVWVWPPHTSMNLNSSPRASSVMDLTRARAAAGSRNSSTNFIPVTSFLLLSRDFGRVERVDLVHVVGAHLLHLIQRQLRLDLVDLRHCETDVHEHPVTDDETFFGEQSHTDRSLDAVHVHLGQMLFGVDDVDHLTGYPQTHRG